jgi:hypothetical protein
MQLFYIDGPRAGTEAPFPGPNDASKLRRSVASTHQQGMASHLMASFGRELRLIRSQVSSPLEPAMETLLGLFAIVLNLCLLRSPCRFGQALKCPVMLVHSL